MVKSLKDVIESINRIVQILSLVIGGVASVSLLVGGVGIMNIMLVTVVERTREIGIRKAVGAKEREIAIQFLSEAASIAILGGIFGIIVGVIGVNIASSIAKWPPIITLSGVLFSFAFSFLIGIIFGLYPAIRASRLNPVEALRFE
ncbi:MAG: FtsX-like permease family protein [Candidatus Aenigmatarchaeota archaeon]